MKELRKVLYIAPRFHTNQVCAVKSLIKSGIEVKFFSQYSHKTEDHDVLTPQIVGYSVLTKIALFFYLGIDRDTKLDKARGIGIPPFWRLLKLIRDYMPDLVILRDRTVYSFVALIICRILKLHFVIYTQTPKYCQRRLERTFKNTLKRFLFGRNEITPIMGKRESTGGYIDEEAVHYVPLVVDPKPTDETISFQEEDSPVKIMMVSEFVRRKRIIESLEVINRLKTNGYGIRLTIIGNAKKVQTREHYQRVKEYIVNCGLENNVILLTDIAHERVMEEYEEHDIFILPSIKESAGYSLLEAMSRGLPVICTEDNGLKECIAEGENGFIMENDNFDQLYEHLRRLIVDRELRERFGKKSIELVRENFSSQNYLQGIVSVFNQLNVKDQLLEQK